MRTRFRDDFCSCKCSCKTVSILVRNVMNLCLLVYMFLLAVRNPLHLTHDTLLSLAVKTMLLMIHVVAGSGKGVADDTRCCSK